MNSDSKTSMLFVKTLKPRIFDGPFQESHLKDCKMMEGKFVSPFEHILPGLMPKESIEAKFQMVLPHKWEQQEYKPVCIQLAGTGDHVRLINTLLS